MVHGTVHLDDGEMVIIQAKDMLTALRMATEKYQSRARRMHFATVSRETMCMMGWLDDGEEVMPDG